MIVHFSQCQVNINENGERELIIVNDNKLYLCRCEDVPDKYQQIYAYWLECKIYHFQIVWMEV